MYSNSFTALTMFLTAILKSFWLMFSAPLAKQQELAQQLAVCQAEADRLFFQATEEFRASQLTAALQSGQQALAIYREVSSRQATLTSRANEGHSLNLIGQVKSKLRQYLQALKSYQQALVIFRELGDRKHEGITVDNIGSVYVQQGQYSQAMESRQRALFIFREIGDRMNEAVTLTNIGSTYHKLGQYLQTLECYQQALTIYTQTGQYLQVGMTFDNIGIVYIRLGQYAQALEYSQRALFIFRELSNSLTLPASPCLQDSFVSRLEEGRTLYNIGAAYSGLGQCSQALEFYEQALAIFREVGALPDEEITLRNIKNVYRQLG